VSAKPFVRRTDEVTQSRVTAIEIGRNAHVRTLYVFEQQGAFAVFLRAFRDCCQLKLGIHLPIDNGELAALSQLPYEVPNDDSPCETRSASMVHTSMIDGNKCNDQRTECRKGRYVAILHPAGSARARGRHQGHRE
jgi:hypothetical protein